MSAATAHKPIVHFVGSIPLPDAETVFRTLTAATAPHLKRLPDGETGIRRTWIRFLQQVLADNPAIEVASDVPSFKFTQWDGELLREIPRLRVKPGTRLDPATVKTHYADMAIESWGLFDRLQQEGVIPAGVKFQISLPTPIAPTYNNMVPTDRPALIPVLTTHMLGEVAAIAQALPNDRIALQWDVCQEVIAWEGYYEPGPVDFRKETIAELIAIGNGVPASIELGYHLCYGSPADEHVIQPKDAGIIQGVQHYLWRAVDQEGVVLDILVQPRRDAKAAKRFFRRLLKGLQYVPRVIVTDKLRSYGVAQRMLLPKAEHRQSRYLNNRAENSHRPTRRRERQMQRFKSPEQANDFLSAHAFIYGHFHPRRHLLAASTYRALRTEAFNVWKQDTCVRNAA